ncbi:MAG: CC0125/CC1285 family lipoprotein [Alphaproteobacteria bacterium]
MQRRTLRAGLLVAIMLLAACAGPPLYQPLTSARSFGYTERAVGVDLYEISYDTPRRTTYAIYSTDRESDRRLQLAYDLALLRAAELAISRTGKFSINRRDNDARVNIHRNYDSYGTGYSPYYRHTTIPYSRRDTEPYAVISARVTLLVDYSPPSSAYTFNAAETAARLRRQYSDELPL